MKCSKPLRDAFIRACAARDTTGAQELRRHMRAVVDEWLRGGGQQGRLLP